MLRNYHICFLTLIASTGFALGLLGAIATLWSNTPTEEGLASFAFALAVAFAAVLGNLLLFGAHLLIGDQGTNTASNKITAGFSIIVFLLGLTTASILFTEGLNTWFAKSPTMPSALIMILRTVIFIPFVWFLFLSIAKILPKKTSKKPSKQNPPQKPKAG